MPTSAEILDAVPDTSAAILERHSSPPRAEPAFDELAFRRWYAPIAARWGIDPNPDDPRHFYDYRAAYRSGALPDSTGHWPSAFKLEGHPRMVVDGVNTKTGEFVGGQYTGASDLPVEPNPLSPADLIPFLGPAGRFATSAGPPVVGRILPWLLRAAPRAGAAMGAIGVGSDLAEGQNPAPALPGNVLTGAVAGPALESAGRLAGTGAREGIRFAGRGFESLNRGLARSAPAPAAPAPSSAAGAVQAPTAGPPVAPERYVLSPEGKVVHNPEIRSAFRLTDGTVVADPEPGIHADLFRKMQEAGGPVDRIAEGGFVKDGQFIPGSADASRLAAEGRVAAKRAAAIPPTPEPPYISGARPESGGPTERVFRPDKIGLPEGSPELQRVTQTFDALGLDTRRIRSFQDMRDAAQDLGLTIDDLLKAPQHRPLADAEVVAIRNDINASASAAQQASAAAARAGATNAEISQARALEQRAQQRIEIALKRLSVGGTETGRAVAAFRIIGQRSMDPAYWYRTAQAQLRGREFTPEIRQAIDEFVASDDRVGLARLMASLRKATTTEKAITLWKAGLLSNPATDIGNIQGNVFMSVMESAKDIPATFFDRLYSIASGERTKALSPTIMKERLKGFGTGAVKAARYLKEGDTGEELLGKYDFNHQVNFDNKILQGYTQAVFRRLGAEDVLFREPALRASVAEQAIIQARNAGLKGEPFLARVRDLIKSPTEAMLKIAQSGADYATFQGKSPLASHIGNFPGGWKVAAEVAAPFRRTPVNIANAILDYSPFGVPKAAIGWAMRRGGDAMLRQKYTVETLGRSVTGTTLFALGWEMAEAGIAVGIHPPQNEQEIARNRQAQRIPDNAVLVNGNWTTLDRLAPASNVLLLGVNAYEQFQRNPDLAGKLGGTAGAGIKTLSEQTFVKGAGGLLGAMTAPEREAGRFISGLAASVIPSLVGAVARGTDTKQRRARGLLEGVEARVPGARENLQPVIDVRGREVPAPKGLAASLLSPVTATPADTDVVARALKSSGYGPAVPTGELKASGGRKVKLEGAELVQFQKEMGEAFDKAMRVVASSPRFFQLDPDEQQKRLSDVVERAQEPVRNKWKYKKFIQNRGAAPRKE